MKVRFTKHAKKKFSELAKIGVLISKQTVIKAIREPENIDSSDAPKMIASRPINSRNIIRVVFRIEDDIIIVITFYPARKGRYYEKKN